MNTEMFDFDTAFENMMQSHDLDTVVLAAHMNPDGDACGSVMSLAHYIHVNYPQYAVYPYLSEKLDRGPKMMAKQDRFFDPFTAPDISGKPYAMIVCDTATLKRLIGREYLEGAAATMLLDHHAANEGYAEVNYVKISESNSENIFFILDQEKLEKAVQAEDYPNAADYIYLGIVHDTSAFSRAQATTMEAAAQLLAMGVDHSRIQKTYFVETYADIMKRNMLQSSAKLLMNGKVACVCVNRQMALEQEISYEDIHPISGYLRDCSDIELGVTMYEEAPNWWRCSFRSDGKWLNVNELLKPFGGGGHAAASGLRIETDDPQGLLEKLMAQVEEMTK